MALIECPECKAQVSDQAKACPQCGYSLPKQPRLAPETRQGLAFIAVLVGVVLVAWVGWRVIGADDLIDGRRGDPLDLWRVKSFLENHTTIREIDARDLRNLRVFKRYICGEIWRYYTPKYANLFEFGSGDGVEWRVFLYSPGKKAAYTFDPAEDPVLCPKLGEASPN